MVSSTLANEPSISGEVTPHDAVGVPRLLEIRDLRVSFRSRGGEIRAVRGVNLNVEAGQTLGIVGESGSGKSVTVRALMGILPSLTAVIAGEAFFNGRDLLKLSRKELRPMLGRDLAMVFQDPMRSLNPTIPIGRQIAEAIRNHNQVTRDEARDQAIELLRLVRISAPASRYSQFPHQLSGGMRQRVMIAIAVACRPKLLIADEPTTALDVTTQAQIMELLQELQRELNMGLILVSHDLGLMARYADRLAVMYAGKTVETGETASVFERPRMPYTAGLIESIPRRGVDRSERLKIIAGEPPNPSISVPGCSFSPRCRYADEKCQTVEPSLFPKGAERAWACWHPLEETKLPSSEAAL
jgi:oligopeptide/dipeptide ABC transporter ATP-binding protein